MKKDQQGFSAVEVLLIIVIVGIIGGVGWYVWHAKQQKPVASQSNPPAQTTSTEKEQPKSEVPVGYKEYKNTQYKFSFIYPEDWIQQDVSEGQSKGYLPKGVVAALVSPEQDKIYKDFKASGRPIDSPPMSSLVVSRWTDINDSEAKGGESSDDRHYSSLADFLTETNKTKQKIGEIDLNGQKAYEIIIGGFSANYGIILERADGIYELSFPTIYDKKEATNTPEIGKIVNSLKFN